MLLFMHSYKNIPTYVTENGLAWQEDTVEQAVNDTMRQQYLHDHIDAVGQALQAGCDVKGYFVWSFQVICAWRHFVDVGFVLLLLSPQLSAVLCRVFFCFVFTKNCELGFQMRC